MDLRSAKHPRLWQLVLGARQRKRKREMKREEKEKEKETFQLLAHDERTLLHAPHLLRLSRVVLEPRMHRLDLVLHALDGLEVLDGLDLELGGRLFVGDDERPGVQLYGGEGPLWVGGGEGESYCRKYQREEEGEQLKRGKRARNAQDGSRSPQSHGSAPTPSSGPSPQSRPPCYPTPSPHPPSAPYAAPC